MVPALGGLNTINNKEELTSESMEVDTVTPASTSNDFGSCSSSAIASSSGGDTSAPTASSDWYLMPRVDDSNTTWLNKPPMERFVSILDQLDAKVERLRKDALLLQEKKDFLAMSVDLLRHNEYLTGLNESEREEINCYVQRISGRLATVELSVCTVRDRDQEDSLHHVNSLIDTIISTTDPVHSRLRCQQFLNACSATDVTTYTELDPALCTDKKFENALLGCTLDDQKNIKKRLQALLAYLSQQTIVH